ncbi:hypothetical protein ACFC8U_07645 [Enterococcus casseliflavus]|uniref:hypothetical protein n=1 Tax=Enterococcus casseliflavus TaxID=37734 RepID=UPI0039A73A3A
MKKRVVISESALVGMLILGTTFPSTWPIAQASETQQTKQQTPSIDSTDIQQEARIQEKQAVSC